MKRPVLRLPHHPHPTDSIQPNVHHTHSTHTDQEIAIPSTPSTPSPQLAPPHPISPNSRSASDPYGVSSLTSSSLGVPGRGVPGRDREEVERGEPGRVGRVVGGGLPRFLAGRYRHCLGFGCRRLEKEVKEEGREGRSQRGSKKGNGRGRADDRADPVRPRQARGPKKRASPAQTQIRI